jgi:hypothetical protein
MYSIVPDRPFEPALPDRETKRRTSANTGLPATARLPRPVASLSLAGSIDCLRPAPHSAPLSALPATSGSTAGPNGPPPARAHMPEAVNAEYPTAYLLQRLMRRTPRSEPKGTIQEIRLKDRLQDQQGRHWYHPVAHRRDTQRSQLPIRLRNGDALHRPPSFCLS